MKTLKPDSIKNIKFEYKITLTYLIFGILWILFSDELLDLLVKDVSLLTTFQTFKGTFFILVTSGFLYMLVRKHIQSLILSELNFHRSISESPVGIRIVSVEGKTIYANKAFLDIY